MKIEELSNDNRVAKDATGVRLAQRIRELRVERGLTLQEVSDAAGFSSGLLSKIENCVVSPPVSTLAKLAEALDVPIGEFFQVNGEEEATIFFPADGRKRATGRRSSVNYVYEMLTPTSRRRQMQPMIVTVDGKTYRFALQDHPGEQFVLLLEGEMDYIVGDKQFSMKPEDCLYFEARLSHGPKLTKDQRARYLVVFSKP
jgi:transcriptional regulator with XRE-family HTH domain